MTSQSFGFLSFYSQFCLFYSAISTNNLGFTFNSVNPNSNSDDKYSLSPSSPGSLLAISKPFLPTTEDLINVGRTCKQIPVPTYPNVTFVIGESSPKTFTLPKHIQNSHTLSTDCQVAL